MTSSPPSPAPFSNGDDVSDDNAVISTKAESEKSGSDGERIAAMDINIHNMEFEEPTALIMDEGLTAWLQVLGSWILFWNTW